MLARIRERKYAERFRKEVEQLYPPLADQQPERRQRGRRGHEAFRAAVHELLSIYQRLYGRMPTHTKAGPAVRFVEAAFAGVDGDWSWQAADEFDQEHGEGAPLILTQYRLRDVVMPVSAREAIRDCLDHSQKSPIPPMPKYGLVAGYFWHSYRSTGGNRPRNRTKNLNFTVARPTLLSDM
jgi:hypothetical protein